MKILLPIDGSAVALEAVRCVIRMAAEVRRQIEALRTSVSVSPGGEQP